MSDSKIYPPSAGFSSHARIKSMDEYRALYGRAEKDIASFWGELAGQELTWFRPYLKTLEWETPYAKWFQGGKINACYNCVDRHVLAGRKDKRAIIWEGEPGETRTITYQELQHLVNQFATILMRLGLETGDAAVIYMPMVPELADRGTGLRASGRRTQRGVRRFFRRGVESSHSRFKSQSCDHRGRCLAAR